MDLYKTAADLVCLKQKISTGDSVLDSLLEGGFSTRELCEISGESSSGKTQICLQLLVHSTVSEKRCCSKAVYFHTEGDAPLDRLREIADTCIDRHGWSTTTEEVLDKIYTEKIIDAEENLVHRLLDVEELLAQSERGGCPVKVLIIDSIAYPFRDVDYTVPALQRRSTFFFGISAILRRLADEYNVAVIVTNHVVDLFQNVDENADVHFLMESFPGCAGLELSSSGRSMYPALGLSWANCVNTRVFTSREAVDDGSGAHVPIAYTGSMRMNSSHHAHAVNRPQLRGIQIVFSSEVPQAKVHFIIDHGGCHGIGRNQLSKFTSI